jgi:hypothetical protein
VIPLPLPTRQPAGYSLCVTSRPAPRKSCRAPKRERIDLELSEVLEPLTIDGLKAAVYLQNRRRHAGLKSRHLSRIATDLELAFIEKRPKDYTDRLCLDVAATALRILEQGD